LVRDLASGTTAAALTGPGNYRQLAIDRAGTQLAFVSDRDDFRADKPRFTLYHSPLRAPKAVAAVAAGSIDGLSPVDRGRLEFTREGNAILFGIAPPAQDSIPADSLADKAVYDLWHWKDPRLQPQQRLDAQRDRNRAFTAVWHVKSRKAIRLADDEIPMVNVVSDDARLALGVTNLPYAIESMWGDGGSDVYVIDATTGRRTQVAEKLQFQAQLSPGAKYVVWFDEGRWWSHATATGKQVDLTGALKSVRFDQETWDSPSTPAPWGLGGWTKGDASLLVYDRYDIWEVDPAGARAPRMVTDSVGARGKLVLRAVDLDAEERFIDPAKPLLLRAFDDETKASGFYRDRLGVAAAPEKIVMADRAFGNPQKARKGETVLLTQSTVSEFPDLWAGASFDRMTKITNANPQQSQYPWPSVELVDWLSDDGVPLKGLVYKPENFDASKQYPMIVYYYEMLSDNLHQYHAPTGRNVINPTVYTSLGYIVFFPDIVYTTGWPGPSAVKAILPGVKSVMAKGYVNPKAVGIAGQSWGGYQSAYLITQTSLFAAAVPNAPVVNMTSAYGGIRWGSGVARPFQYEKTQSRIGGSLWEYPMRFIENSPLFQLDRVTTPVFFMHNDADDAVPWYQGIEFYVAMRRLNKEVYFVTYNGDVHNPRKRANQKDVDLKMQQFFANKLKGEPAPDWMVKGIPFLEKGRDQVKMGATVQP
jgi:dipeptidyl aminopeptidase/acylaminoacyl peptidase